MVKVNDSVKENTESEWIVFEHSCTSTTDMGIELLNL